MIGNFFEILRLIRIILILIQIFYLLTLIYKIRSFLQNYNLPSDHCMRMRIITDDGTITIGEEPGHNNNYYYKQMLRYLFL
jgi:hypothetical protein